MKQIILFFIFYLFLGIDVKGEELDKSDTIQITFNGKTFRKLRLAAILANSSEIRPEYEGYTTDYKTWTFIYPDKIYDNVNWFNIIIPDSNDSIRETITFKTIVDKDTLSSGSCMIDRGFSKISLSYIQTDEAAKRAFHDFNTGKREKQARQEIKHNYLVLPTSDRQLIATIDAGSSEFSKFIRNTRKGKNLTYDMNLDMYSDLVKKYPYSVFMAQAMANTLNMYRSKEDVWKIYQHFSDSIKKSPRGERIMRFITDTIFINTELKTYDTEQNKQIIEDSSKYNLIIFSASWCGPCHKQIPLLKQIYEDLNGKLCMTYVSIDEDEKAIENWRKLIRKEEIPWRSLITGSKTSEIRNKYFIKGIPHSILVYPNGHKMVIDIRKASDKELLYNLVGDK